MEAVCVRAIPKEQRTQQQNDWLLGRRLAAMKKDTAFLELPFEEAMATWGGVQFNSEW